MVQKELAVFYSCKCCIEKLKRAQKYSELFFGGFFGRKRDSFLCQKPLKERGQLHKHLAI